jgi:cellulase/cellobiase CelA1
MIKRLYRLPRAARAWSGVTAAITASAAVVVAMAATLAVGSSASAAAGCQVTYALNSWNTGFTANLTITNLGDPITNWRLEFDFSGNQRVALPGWSANYTQDGQHVTATNMPYNGTLGTGASTTVGFNGTYSGENQPVEAFAVNGVACTGTAPTPTSPTPTTTSPTPTPQPGDHVPNPYAGARGYINPDYAAQVRSAAAARGGDLGTRMARVADIPTAVWLDRIAAVTGGSGVTRNLRGHLDAALAQRSGSTPVVITLVVYDLPNRDCAALASNGELLVSQNGLNRYKTEYIDPIASALGDPKYRDLRIVTIVEPDSLPNLVTNLGTPACAEANSSGAYVQGIQYAINKLQPFPNVYKYIDLAHSGWLGWDSNFGPAVQLITNTIRGTSAGLNSIDGFISATANYTPTTEPFLPNSNLQVGGQPVRSSTFYEWNPYFDEQSYGTAMRQAFMNAGFPNGIGMLVDTSRNGWGGPNRPSAVSTSTDLNTYVNQSRIDRRPHRGGWCNQNGAGIGARPQAAPTAGFDAWVWIKPPGESDGVSSNVTDPNDPNKKFDAMCDPNAQNRYNNAFPTNALPNAPHAGRWFQAQFEMLVQNSFPPL